MSDDLKIEKINQDISMLISKEQINDEIFKIQKIFETSQGQIEIPVKHYFSKNTYAREIKIPKGSYVIGKVHRFENLNILSSGEISIISIDGIQRVKAPFTVVSSPGVKRLAYAHEDCTWTTIHGTSETDVEKIEKEFITEDPEEIKNILNGGSKCLT